MAQINGNNPDFDGPLDFNRHSPRPTLEEWRHAAERSLRGRPLESLTVVTHERIEIKPLYTAEDLPAGGSDVISTGNGEWESCVAVRFMDPDEAIRQVKDALSRGAQSIRIRVDRRSSAWGR